MKISLDVKAVMRAGGGGGVKEVSPTPEYLTFNSLFFYYIAKKTLFILFKGGDKHLLGG